MSRLTNEIFTAAQTRTTSLVTMEAAGLVRRSWRAVNEVAAGMAAALMDLGVDRGDRVAVLAGEPSEIAPLVQAVWMRGASVTMLHQPTPRTDLTQWMADTMAVVNMIDAAVVVVGDPFLPAASVLAENGIGAVSTAELLGRDPVDPVPTDDDDLALLQLTSGSTGSPKAVVITHGNIIEHSHALAAATGVSFDNDIMVSWLPLFHDMGMVAFLIAPMQSAVEAVCVRPQDFLKSPSLWPRLITEYRGTMTAAPNFAYSVLARNLDQAPDGVFDLSSLRLVLNGAEPIDPHTVTRLVESGSRFGLRPSAIVCGYGMAEATLSISFAIGGMRIDTIDPAALESTGVALPSSATHARQLVNLGTPLNCVDVRVVDESRTPMAARHVGEIEIRGESVSSRLLTSSGEEPTLHPDSWFSTGDLGYLLESGEIVVCGRKKDLIIVGGRNVFPTDIERAAARIDGVRAGGVAAVRLPRAAATEEFAVVVESRSCGEPSEVERIASQVAEQVLSEVGASPSRVVVVFPGSLPKTPSGKVRRTDALALVYTEDRSRMNNDPVSQGAF